MKPTYIRFVTRRVDPDSQREEGVFQAAHRLCREGNLSDLESARLTELLDWFKVNLKAPTRLTSAKPPHHNKKNRAICWFKGDAILYLSNIWEIVRLLEHHGLFVQMIKTNRPGYIVYEDDYQIAAEPFADSL